ncbi:hypothetical protein Tco_0885964 [Tanacetum coccineum]
MNDNHWMDKWLKEVLMIDWLSTIETDKRIHTMEIDIVKLVVEIESFGMSFDEFDKETVSVDELQLGQADLSCVPYVEIIGCVNDCQHPKDRLSARSPSVENCDDKRLLFDRTVIEKNYKNDKLINPHHITTASFNKTPSASEVPLTSHMLKVAKISEPEKSLLLSSREVNSNSVADKSLSRTAVQSTTKEAVVETKHAEESGATADIIESLDGSKPAEEVRSLPKTTAIEKIRATPDPIESFSCLMLTLKTLDFARTYNILRMKVRPQECMNFTQPLGFDDEFMSISGDEDELADSDKELSAADEIEATNVFDEILTEINTKDTTTLKKKNIPHEKPANVQALATMQRFKKIKISSALGLATLTNLNNKIDSVIPRMVVDALEERLPELLNDTLRNQLP